MKKQNIILHIFLILFFATLIIFFVSMIISGGDESLFFILPTFLILALSATTLAIYANVANAKAKKENNDKIEKQNKDFDLYGHSEDDFFVKFCVKCGAELKPTDKFCHECGNKVDDDK